MRAFCTIVTPDYLSYAYALHDSVLKNSTSEDSLFVFISCKKNDFKKVLPEKSNVYYLFIDEICSSGTGLDIYRKYYESFIDGFRWSMKPVLINYLFNVKDIEKVIYVDCDIRFYSSYDFLFESLNNVNVLLSPHFRSSDPVKDYDNFIMQFNSGIYNGGFVGASVGGSEAMSWWANACLEICSIDQCKGQFVDQTHLNLIPVFFDKVEIIKHRGCNVANWNQLECKRIRAENGNVLINNKYPVVFIHFTKSTITGIVNGKDALLLNYFIDYSENIRKYNPTLDLLHRYTVEIKDPGQINTLQNKSDLTAIIYRKFKSFLSRS